MTTGQITPKVLVSWNGTGTFDGPYDDVTGDVFGEPGLTIAAGKDGSRTLDPPKVVSAGFELINDDGTYSQERPSSPVYQLVIPGRAVKIQALVGATDHYDAHTPYDETDPYDGLAAYDVARCAIDGISQTTELGNYRVKFDTLGIETLLVAGAVTVAVMNAPRVDQCVTAILDAVGWPADKRSVAVSDTTLLYWWCDDRSPWDALLELLRAEGPGALYVDGNAVFHFENRNYRTITSRSTTSQASFFDKDAGHASAYDETDPYDMTDFYDGRASGLWFTALSYDPGFRNIYNRATYATKRRQVVSIGRVWDYGGSITLAPSETRTVIARPSDLFQNAVTPREGTDYVVSAGSATVALTYSSGFVAFITITAGGSGATIAGVTTTGIQLRAESLPVVDETTMQNRVDASTSIAKFSPIPGQDIPRVLQVGGWPEIDQPNAQSVCDAWVNRYMVQRPAVTIALRNANFAHVLQMLRRAVSDRITLLERNTGLSADVWINSIQHQANGGGVWATILGCEKVEEVGGGIWDLSLWDTGVWGV